MDPEAVFMDMGQFRSQERRARPRCPQKAWTVWLAAMETRTQEGIGILSSGFAILEQYADPPEYRGHRQRHEHHVQGDVSAHDCGELSRRPGAVAGRVFSRAV